MGVEELSSSINRKKFNGLMQARITFSFSDVIILLTYSV